MNRSLRILQILSACSTIAFATLACGIYVEYRIPNDEVRFWRLMGTQGWDESLRSWSLNPGPLFGFCVWAALIAATVWILVPTEKGGPKHAGEGI